MNNIILALNFITAMLAAIKQMIATLDEAMPDGTPGQAKLDVVKGWVEQAIAAEQDHMIYGKRKNTPMDLPYFNRFSHSIEIEGW